MLDAVLSALLAMLATLLAGQIVLPELRRRKLGKSYTGDEPAEYEAKAGTPTMGGLIFLPGIAIAGVAFGVLRDSDVHLPLVAMLVAAALGSVDDFQTLVGKQKLSGHETWFWLVKWAVLIGLGLIVALGLYGHFDLDSIVVPHYGAYSLGAVYMPVVVLVFVAATSGAVITDGMDGLMAGVSAFAYTAYGVIALSQGQDALGAFAFAVVGATAGFLWYNSYPAQVFMGEVGALALAVGLVVVAFMTGWWLLLPVIGVVYFAEGLSDVIQIGYFKLTHGRRVFRMAPIHYHFQLGGWPETRVVARFWLIAMLGSLAGTALALVN